MRSRIRTWFVVLMAATALTLVVAPAATASVSSGAVAAPSNAVTAWNAIAGQAALDCGLAPFNNPLHESRMYATMHIAIHDALNAIDRRSAPYAFFAPRLVPGASPDASVASAARTALVSLVAQLPEPFSGCAPAAIATVEAAYTAALEAIPTGNAKAQGIDLGRAAAAAILAVRTGDGSDTELFDANAPQGTDPGEYRFTPQCVAPAPASCTTPYPFAFAPGWADVTPFALKDSAQFRPGPPYDVTSERYAADFNEVKRRGRDTSTIRTADQTQIAQFWFESSPLQWNRIARTVATATPNLTLWDHARLFGLLNIAMADGYIGSFDTKRFYNSWRPVTAIREAATDGNPATTADPTWTPLIGTPPIPSYNSAHAVEGATAARVMNKFFGTDRRTFSTCSLSLPGGETCADGNAAVYRTYTSFSQAARENGVSRILVGIHFRQDVNSGLHHGHQIAERTVATVMQPTR